MRWLVSAGAAFVALVAFLALAALVAAAAVPAKRPCRALRALHACAYRTAGVLPGARAAWMLAPLAALVTGLSGCAPPDDEVPLHVATHARATIRPEGGAQAQREVRLTFRWDQAYPGQGGQVRFEIDLPPAASLVAPRAGSDTPPPVILLERVGNQARVSLNGELVREIGRAGDARFDAGKQGQRIAPPRSLWRSGQPNVLAIDLTTQPLRGGALGPVRVGAAEVVDRALARRQAWQQTLPAAYAATLLLIGALAAALWWRQRDALYGCFSLAALAGMLRYLDATWQPAPLPWPAWGALLAMGYGLHLALTARFILLLLERNPPWLVRTLNVMTVAVVALAITSFVRGEPVWWTGALVSLLLIGLACFGVVLDSALRRHQARAWVVLGAGTLLLAAGAHDIVRVRLGLAADDAAPLTPHALFTMVVILASLFVNRFNRSVADYRALNATLAERVAEREQRLTLAFDALREQRDQQAVLGERQRLMREIHDGIGSQLVALLNMVSDPKSERAALAEQVREALDEMRIAVDSLQPGFGELTTVLATLRYRLQPRLAAAGIEMAWDVAALPGGITPAPQAALHLQRIVLEAITNVLKHAGATRLRLSAGLASPGDEAASEPCVTIRVHDNGRGLPTQNGGDTRAGHGMRNMQARAQSIGARLRVGAAPEGGTEVRLEWPLAAARGAK